MLDKTYVYEVGTDFMIWTQIMTVMFPHHARTTACDNDRSKRHNFHYEKVKDKAYISVNTITSEYHPTVSFPDELLVLVIQFN